MSYTTPAATLVELAVHALAQVKLYFPEAGYPGFGLIRAMVKDSTDAYQEGASRVWLDSDGLVGVSADERNEQSKQLAAGQVLV